MKLRSSVLAGLAAGAAAALALAGCGAAASASGSSSGGTIVVYASGDVNVQQIWQQTLIPGFEKAEPQYRVKLVFSEHGTTDSTVLARLGAAVKTNSDPGEDIIDGGFTTAATSGWTEPVSTANVPNLKDVDPALLTPVDGAAIPYRASSVVLAYNSQYVPNPPKTLAALLAWIKANPGRFTYNSPASGGSGQSFVTTVLDANLSVADQQKFENGYPSNLEGEWDPGFATLKSLDPDVYQHVYPNGNTDVLTLLAKGEIWLAPVWSDQSLSMKADGQLPSTIKLTQISDPTFTGSPAYLIIPKTAAHKTGAEALANWILAPAQQAAIAKAMSGYPVIPISQLPAALQAQFAGMDPNNLRPPYSTQTNSDLNNLWQQKVPS